VCGIIPDGGNGPVEEKEKKEKMFHGDPRTF